LEALRTDSEIAPAQVRFVEETLLLILRGARAALPTADLAVVPSGTPTARALSEEERYLDDLLGDCMAGRAGGSMPFAVFAAVARSPRWELKRRLAEALPALLEHAADSSYIAWTIPLMETLRDDPPDPQWRTDIRRRAIEAAPTLWRVRPEAVSPLLRWREGDEVYAVLGSLDALASIGDEELTNEIRADLLAHTEVGHRRAVALYAELLDRSVLDPDAALRTIDEHREDPERLVRVCLARSLRHLLSARPAETLKEMRYFLRRGRGAPASAPPVEHQNVRRERAPLAAHAGRRPGRAHPPRPLGRAGRAGRTRAPDRAGSDLRIPAPRPGPLYPGTHVERPAPTDERGVGAGRRALRTADRDRLNAALNPKRVIFSQIAPVA